MLIPRITKYDPHYRMASNDPSLETITRNVKGDLVVIVGSEVQQKFRCNKDALRMASDTWHAMLENKTEAHGTVDELVFADDDPGALRVLLLATHQRRDDLPPVSSLKALAKVARLCDKYACEATVSCIWVASRSEIQQADQV